MTLRMPSLLHSARPRDPLQTTPHRSPVHFNVFPAENHQSVCYQIFLLQMALCQVLKVLSVICFVGNILQLPRDLVSKNFSSPHGLAFHISRQVKVSRVEDWVYHVFLCSDVRMTWGSAVLFDLPILRRITIPKNISDYVKHNLPCSLREYRN